MSIREIKYKYIVVLLCCIAQLSGTNAFAQNAQTRRQHEAGRDSIQADSLIKLKNQTEIIVDSSANGKLTTNISLATKQDSLNLKSTALRRIREQFRPNPKKAMWMALIFPGGGQIYNRKYWKLPLVYGGFMGCYYALRWNNMMYKDYSQAYLDMMDNDPNTKSYEKMIPLRYSFSENEERFKKIFKNRKDFYRRYRDLSVFCFIGVYLLSVVDAYVDAELSNFDISKDLSLKIEPSVMNTGQSYTKQALGVHCSLNF